MISAIYSILAVLGGLLLIGVMNFMLLRKMGREVVWLRYDFMMLKKRFNTDTNTVKSEET